MTNKKQILLAFFIPLFLAIVLLLLADSIFPAKCTTTFIKQGKEVCLEYHEESSFTEMAYGLAVVGLFILSIILPSLKIMRTYQGRQNRLGSPSIFE